MYTVRSDIHSFNTRHKNRLDVPYGGLEKTSQGFEIMGLRLMNTLPVSMRNLSYNTFRNRLSKYLLDNPCYNLKGFFSLSKAELA